MVSGAVELPALGHLLTVTSPFLAQGNLVAVKRVNRKRIELTREVLFELKHVMWGVRPWPGGESGDTGVWRDCRETQERMGTVALGWAFARVGGTGGVEDGRRDPGGVLAEDPQGVLLDGLRKQRR